jgi:BirA family biotin operon repressor/biotin-[acetyl-CoA-carboxylase] ligase
MGFGTYFKELHKLQRVDLGNWVVLQRVSSTHQLARKLVAECGEDGVCLYRSWILAYAQTEGRGRRGNGWVSPPGAGVYATLILPLEQTGEEAVRALTTLPLLVASALCDALEEHLDDVSCRLKWPNDLRVEGAKIGGILIEVSGCEGHGRVAVVGFGINHLPRQLSEVGQPTTALGDHQAKPPSLARLTWDLIEAVDERLEKLGDVEYAIKRYQGLSEHSPGDRLHCRVGEETLEGIFRGFDERGFLRLETATGERLLAAGEVLDT